MSAVRPLSVTFPDSPLPDVPVPAELRFDTSRPFAACLSFPVAGRVDDETPRCWYFSRDVLNEGRHVPAGSGDVRVGPGAEGEVRITLSGAGGSAVVSAPTEVVAAFLAESFQLVPLGTEGDHLDIDALVARILDAG
ncbi:SsgA family sporulation/cell division regulator [Kitasatospora sp. A2-31]|uniref:SsgA family sporulation/cell division regulator n=1 Tax=Kitasatospora sp. A2-31 TaxID=2916414 RepID=UPI001EECCC0E|nr:SsgA family sporulation/cell division regulator [Kitasatospora sp. A2-31]MCG6494304.1 SsgA family sporulation/cell division regulator [Kitasatospora sp. A2-31]MCG6500422.1 SsgA family sporulation/cell division regulator [Kitasatospora sp. A2-31]